MLHLSRANGAVRQLC